MKLFIKSIKLVVIYLLTYSLILSQALADEPVNSWAKPIDKTFNLYQVTPLLYRSAMPDADKITILKEHHIATVISLIKDDDKKWLGNTPDTQLISYPTHADRVTDDDVLTVLKMIKKSQKQQQAVLIHCKHGQNRTGLFVAMYRIVIQHWTKAQAVLEMAKGGYSNDLNDIQNAIAYIKKAKVKKIRLALENNKCSTRRLAFCHLFES